MRVATASTLYRYDSLYVAAHAHDVPLACAGRLLSEAGRGLRILLVTLFDSGDGPRAADALPLDHLVLGFPDAPRRDAAHGTFRSVTYGRGAEDDETVPRLAALLDEIGHRTKARHVYAPLGVGHVDHRIAHEAALRAFHDNAERDVFFYEDRPYALLRGAVRVRLGQIGAWLPPEAVGAARPSGPLGLLIRFQRAPHVRAHLRGAGERLRCTGLALGEWWQARAWRPGKALGPRLQPVQYEAEADAALTAATTTCPAGLAALCGGGGFARLAEDYGRRLHGRGHVERYWLLLPQRADVLAAHVAAVR